MNPLTLAILVLTFFYRLDAEHVANGYPVDAGADITACTNSPGISLSGWIDGEDGGKWSTAGDGKFNAHATGMNAVYLPGPEDIAAGEVVLQLSARIGSSIESDRLTIRFEPFPQVKAMAERGADGRIHLEAIADARTMIEWSTNGKGDLRTGDRPEAFYSPAEDEAGGTILFVAQGTNGCAIVADTVLMIVPEAMNKRSNLVLVR